MLSSVGSVLRSGWARAGTALAALNLLAWLLFFALRSPYSAADCQALDLRHAERAAELAREPGNMRLMSDQDHLWAGRPIHSGWAEPPAAKPLYLPNFRALSYAWLMAVPAWRIDLGPSCKESYLVAGWFLLLSTAQWFLVGTALFLVATFLRSLAARIVGAT
jgi:hypothetical protein